MSNEPLQILLVSRDRSSFNTFMLTLQDEKHIGMTFVESAKQAMHTLETTRVDVAIVSIELADMSGLQFVKQLVAQHPFVNCALVSPLYSHEFHEQTEGLGVFMQLPVNPGREAALEMIEHLDRIYQISNEFQQDGQTS
ncbi:MAG: response regulator [Desulfobacterales bacterium]|nr:response regulator [Deltaproteobacteria bacterium]NNK93233.1 response regulator [Desulfobacterales bacterium]